MKIPFTVNGTYIMIIALYSIITFFIAPTVVMMFLKHKYNMEIGFILGFVVSILLWINIGKTYYIKQ